MLAIGRALMAGPRVLLLDEPSLGLAPRIVEQLGEVIREINAQGVTVVLVEQNAAMALAVADDAVVLEVGARGAVRAVPRSSPTATRSESAISASVAEAAHDQSPATRCRPAGSGVAELAVERLTRPLRRHHGARRRVASPCAPGSMHALIGPNGAGKSTCLNVLSGVYAADRRQRPLRRRAS